MEIAWGSLEHRGSILSSNCEAFGRGPDSGQCDCIEVMVYCIVNRVSVECEVMLYGIPVKWCF